MHLSVRGSLITIYESFLSWVILWVGQGRKGPHVAHLHAHMHSSHRALACTHSVIPAGKMPPRSVSVHSGSLKQEGRLQGAHQGGCQCHPRSRGTLNWPVRATAASWLSVQGVLEGIGVTCPCRPLAVTRSSRTPSVDGELKMTT